MVELVGIEGRLIGAKGLKFVLVGPDALAWVFVSPEILVYASLAFMKAAMSFFDIADFFWKSIPLLKLWDADSEEFI